MMWLRRKLLDWLLKEYRSEVRLEIQDLRLEIVEAPEEVRRLQRKVQNQLRRVDTRLAQLNALAAVDLPVGRDAGFVVVVSRVQNEPRVHMTHIPPNFTPDRWRQAMGDLELIFGARTEFIDGPRDMRDFAHQVLRHSNGR